MRNKAQVMTMDVYVSIVFFVTIFALWVFISNQLIAQAQEAYEISMMDKKLQRISDLLIRTKGIPEDWDEGNVRSIGLADPEYFVKFEKVRRLIATDPSLVKSLFGLGNYNYYIELKNLTGNNFPEGEITIGKEPENPQVLLTIKRYFVIDMCLDCRKNGSVFYLHRHRYQPHPILTKSYSAITTAPQGMYTTIELIKDATHTFFYQLPPNLKTAGISKVPSGSYNCTFTVCNPTSNWARVYFQLKYYNASGYYEIQAVNPKNKKVDAGQCTTVDNQNDCQWPVPQPWDMPPNSGLVLEVWTTNSNVTLLFDGSLYPGNFQTPYSYPSCDWPPRTEIGMMQITLWR